jgi:hypothetical protein
VSLWTYEQWSEALFKATFGHDASRESPPVTHIDASDDFLVHAGQRVDPNTSAGDLINSFETTVGRELKNEPIDRALHWSFTTWDTPSVFAILFYLCRVAASQEGFEEKGFYAALRAKTGSKEHTHTTKLADSWRAIQTWLSQNPNRFRQLDLPTRPSYKQIGTTLGLAFPRAKDAAALRELLGRHDELSLSALRVDQVRALFKTNSGMSAFTSAFARVLTDFEELVDGGTANDSDIGGHPFWRAVLAAQRSLEEGAQRHRLGFGIFEPETDCQVFLSAPIDAECGEYVIHQWGELPDEEGVLASGDDATRPVAEAFSGRTLQQNFSALRRAVRSGVLNLSSSSIQEFGRAFSRLLRWNPDIARSLADAVLFRGASPPAGFGGQRLPIANLEGWSLAARDKSSEQTAGPLPESLLLRLRGGVPAGRGAWLAAMGFLPEVVVMGAKSVTLVAEESKVQAEQSATTEVWRLRDEPRPGTWTLRAELVDNRVLQRRVEFATTAYAGNYGEPPANSGFVEWGGPAPQAEHHFYCADVRQHVLASDGAEAAQDSNLELAFGAQSQGRVHFGLKKGLFSQTPGIGLPLSVDLGDESGPVAWDEKLALPAPPAVHLVRNDKLRKRWAALVKRARETNIIPAAHLPGFELALKPKPRTPIIHVDAGLKVGSLKKLAQPTSPELTQPHRESAVPRTLLQVLDAVAKRRTRGLGEGELLEVCAAVIGPDQAHAQQWDLIRSLSDASLLTPHHSGQWSGRAYYPVPPHLRLHKESDLWVATLVGLTDESVQQRVAAMLTKRGAREVAPLTPTGGHFQVRRWTSDAAGVFLKLNLDTCLIRFTQIVPRLNAVLEPLSSIVTRIPNSRKPAQLPDAEKLRCFDWAVGSFSRPRGQEPVELWRLANHNQADEYVLQYDGKFVSFLSRTIGILAAQWQRGESPWSQDVRMLRMKPGRYLPLPLARLLALTADALPGHEGGSYTYHFANDALLQAVVNGFGFEKGAHK